MFHTSYENRPVHTVEKISRKSKVETTGYQPVADRIRDMIASGQQLTSPRSRQKEYDTYGDEDIEINPLRSKSLDIVDVQNIRDHVENVLSDVEKKRAETISNAKKASDKPKNDQIGDVKV